MSDALQRQESGDKIYKGARRIVMMTNWLFFCAGLGVGGFVALTLLVACIARVNKQTSERAKYHMKATEELLRERNEINSNMERHLGRIVNWT